MIESSSTFDEELVSVIVPVYNVEKYVERCIQTLLEQTYSNIEIIIIDDGSPDNSGLICDYYASRDERIKVIHQANQGLSGARNTGIEAAKGQYLSFVDSDDWVSTEMVGFLYNHLKQYDAQISVCGTEICSDKGHVAYHSDNLEEICVFTREEAMRELLDDHKIRNVSWNKLYKKELFNGVRFPVGMVFEDIATTYQLIDKAQRVVYSGRPLYCYYKSDQSIIRSSFSVKKFDKVTALKKRAEFYKTRYPKLADKASETYVKSALNSLVGSYEKKDDLSKYRQLVRTDLLNWLQENSAIKLSPKNQIAYWALRKGMRVFDAIITRACLVVGKFQNNTKRMG